MAFEGPRRNEYLQEISSTEVESIKASKLKKEREPAPLPSKLQELLLQITGLEEREKQIYEQAREITEILKSLEPSNDIERRIQVKLGEELENLGKMLEDNIGKISGLKREEEKLLEGWSTKEKMKDEMISLELSPSAAAFLVIGENPALLQNYEELKELQSAKPEEAQKEVLRAALNLKKEGLPIDQEKVLEMQDEQRFAALGEAKHYETMAKETEKEAVALEKQAAFEEKKIEKQLKEWKKEGIDVEKDELTRSGSAKLALRKLFSKDFSAAHSIYSIAKERAARLREEVTLARMGSEGRKFDAALLREAAENGDLASATKTISSSMMRRAIKSASALAATPGKIRSLFGLG